MVLWSIYPDCGVDGLFDGRFPQVFIWGVTGCLSGGHCGFARFYPHRSYNLIIPSVYLQNSGIQILPIYDEIFELLHQFIVTIFVFDVLMMSLYNDFNQRNLFSMTICSCISVYAEYFHNDYSIVY